jgi:hypothetical protein
MPAVGADCMTWWSCPDSPDLGEPLLAGLSFLFMASLLNGCMTE